MLALDPGLRIAVDVGGVANRMCPVSVSHHVAGGELIVGGIAIGGTGGTIIAVVGVVPWRRARSSSVGSRRYSAWI
jgi:hypothetical protein